MRLATPGNLLKHFRQSLTLVISVLLVLQNFTVPTANAVAAQNSICFDGNNYLTLTTNTNLPTNNDSYTIETWIKTTQASGKGGIAGWGSGSSQASNAFTTYGSGAYHWWYSNDLNLSSAGSNIKNGSWHHIAAQFNGTTRSVYLDGTLLGSDTPGLNHVVTNTSSFSIGGFNGERLNGCLSNLRIVKGIAVYTGNFTVPTSPLQATQSAGTNISAIPSGATVLLLNNTSNYLQDNSSYGYLLTNNGSATTPSDGPTLTPARITTSSLTDTPASRGYGLVDTLTATVLETGTAATGATGTFAFKNNGTVITGCGSVATSSGVASCGFIPRVKDISITAEYSGDVTFGASTSSAITFSVPVVIRDGTNTCSLELSGTYSDSLTVVLSGIYCVASFKGADTYTITIPTGITSVDYLVVGGGGGGGSGGGGGGGVLQGTNSPVTAGGTYAVVVGAGGIGGSGSGSGTNATAGKPSSFSSYRALGGGRGGQGNQAAGSGASGGGAQYDCTNVASCAGTGTVGQGNNGAASTHGGYGGGAGGGGAGSAGGNTILYHIGGNGGNGLASSITGSSVYYGGGGGGSINSNDNAYCGLHAPGNSDSNYYCNGTNSTLDIKGGGIGGLGGGGNGSSYGFSGGTRGQYANATSGTPNTGGGGGGTDPEDIYAGAGGSGIVVLRWVAPTNLKTITFNSNFGTPDTSTQRVTDGASTQLMASGFSRSGYIFSGWTTNADGTGTSYADSSYITTSTDVTLYAKWITGVNKTITFNGNSSTSGSMNAQSAGTATAISSNSFLRTNYTFTGWNTAADGTGYAYVDGAVYAFTTDTTLYAQWVLTRTPYTVTFYANAGDGSTPAQTSDTSTALSLSGFTRSGYNFLGWNTDWSSSSATYIDGQNLLESLRYVFQ